MRQHRYRYTVEHLADARGAPSTYPAPLVFEAGNHDDLFAIGLKLFGEVMLEHRDHPLFVEFAPHVGDFIRRLKRGPA